MVDVIKIASYISQRYEYQYGARIDEVTTQHPYRKLLVNKA